MKVDVNLILNNFIYNNFLFKLHSLGLSFINIMNYPYFSTDLTEF